MFGKKKKSSDGISELLKAAKYARILQTLKDIVKLDVRAPSKDGREETDYAATCSAMKTKARLAIDFVADLDGKDED